MGDYPECERMAEAAKVTGPIGEFLDWLQEQGVQLMVYREDLEDVRPVDERCREREGTGRPENVIPCKPTRGSESGLAPGSDYWSTHCLHWHGREYQDGDDIDAEPGTCCYCGKGREHTVTTRGWVHEQRGFEQLLADWAGIDLKKVEAERRQILVALADANAKAGG